MRFKPGGREKRGIKVVCFWGPFEISIYYRVLSVYSPSTNALYGEDFVSGNWLSWREDELNLNLNLLRPHPRVEERGFLENALVFLCLRFRQTA